MVGVTRDGSRDVVVLVDGVVFVTGVVTGGGTGGVTGGVGFVDGVVVPAGAFVVGTATRERVNIGGVLVVVGVVELLDVPPVVVFDDPPVEGVVELDVGDVGGGVVGVVVGDAGGRLFTLLVAPGVRVDPADRGGNCALQGVANATRALRLNSDNGVLALQR
jgi:hypothetical protein